MVHDSEGTGGCTGDKNLLVFLVLFLLPQDRLFQREGC